MQRTKLVVISILVAAAPSLAHAQNFTPWMVFLEAALLVKFIMLLLVAATIAATIITALKLRSKRLTGGSAFLSSLRAGGPLLGLLGAVHIMIMSLIGYATVGPVPFVVMAPGFVEAGQMIFMGLFSGIAAVIGHWAVESRVDRTVLKA